jgi:protein-tyrosine phosphatase
VTAGARPLPARVLTALLTHPAVMALKRPVKDAWWSLKGRGVINPPLPDDVRSILFVCLGNICRSPFAAVLAERRLRERGSSGIRCASAGISTRQSNRAPQFACEVAESDYGVSLREHRPQTMTRELADTFDLIVVMEAGQWAELRAAYPQARARIVLLSLFDQDGVPGYQRYHIDDPFSQPREAFEASYGRIDRAVTRLLAGLRDPFDAA